MVKSLKERLADKRAIGGDRPERTAVATVADPIGCKTCGVLIKSGHYCDVCFALRVQMRGRVEPQGPEAKKETMPVSTPIIAGNGLKPATTKAPAPLIASERIRAIRKANHLTQVAFGELIGVTGATIANWESGHYLPSAANVQKILEFDRGTAPDPKDAPATVDKPPVAIDADARRLVEAQNLEAVEPEPKRVIPEAITVPDLMVGVLNVGTGDYNFVAEPCSDYPTDPAELARSIKPWPIVAAMVNQAQESDRDTDDTGNVRETDRLRALRAEARAESLQARLNELERELTNPPKALYPEIRDNLDAFRLLVRTFGIDTADQVVELLRG